MIFSISSLGSLKEYIAGYNINILGGFITVFLIPSFYYLLKFHKKQYLLQIGLLIFSIFILVYIFSRATFFGVFTTSILSFAYFLHINIKKKVQLPSFTNYFFVIIVLITLIFLYTKREMFLNSSSFLIRISIWKLFLKEIYTYSLYFGFGLDSPVLHASLPPVLPFELSNNFKEFLNQFGLFLHAHNMIVQMLYNFGIIGFLISVFFVIIIIRYYLKNKPRLSLDKVFTFSLMGMAIHELFDFTFFDTSILIPSVILIGLLVQSKSEKVISDSLINKFVVISLVLIFFFSIDIVSFLNQTRIIRNNYITDSIGNFIIKKDEVIEKENFERFVFYDSLRIYKKWNYKSNQLSGEFFYSLYKREKKPEFLNKANDYYEDCIQNNKYLTVCYYRLSQINKDLGNNTKSKEMEDKSRLYDKYNIFVNFYKQWD
ncbi:MAG: O-antigen ligase family protein [Leptospiraceae bacterium]|nr:O-antigen ligase family protein [Leptospiraceae bacterium]MCP5512339.1 O-antigen ligase family protein [Leptospiraceae bacterium]